MYKQICTVFPVSCPQRYARHSRGTFRFHPILSRAAHLRDFLHSTHTLPFTSRKNCYCSVLPASAVLWPLLTSQRSIVHHCTGWIFFLSQSIPLRPPRISALTFIPYICRIYTTKFGQYRTSLCSASSSTLHMPYMRFLFVRPGFCYCLLSDSTSQWTPLAFANSSYWQGLYRTFTDESMRMPRILKKGSGLWPEPWYT